MLPASLRVRHTTTARDAREKSGIDFSYRSVVILAL